MDHLQYAYVGDNFISYGLQEGSADAVLFVGGWPDAEPSKDKAEFFHDRGYHVFLYQYKGLYRSHGKFLQESPTSGIARVADAIRGGELHNLYTDAPYSFSVDRLFVIGSSFGGCALGAAPSADPDAMVLFAPVWNFASLAEEGGEDLFVHYSEIDTDGFKSLDEDDRVEFTVGHTDKGPNAQDVVVIG